MKNFLILIAMCFAFMACNHRVDYYDPEAAQERVEAAFQAAKFKCVNADLAYATNFYGMSGLQTRNAQTVYSDYYLCLEDLGGSALDYNDVVIRGGFWKDPVVVYRGGDNIITITHGKASITLQPGYGECEIPMTGFKNMHMPDSWHGVKIYATTPDGKRYEIPAFLKKAEDQPAMIGTFTTYNFHTDENSMSEEEFVQIPYYK